MELETLDKAVFLKERLVGLKRSKETLDKLTEGKDDIYLQIYIEECSDPFVIPKGYGREVINLIFSLIEKETNNLEQQFKEL
jgi:hypothetical protein